MNLTIKQKATIKLVKSITCKGQKCKYFKYNQCNEKCPIAATIKVMESGKWGIKNLKL